mmetsp:Transcript_50069/g.112754  ORF Transcript_50069/g.112754 Transcript_50069/m.112754 type:complete len:359 (-) Transcript_50069:123-1199(-)
MQRRFAFQTALLFLFALRLQEHVRSWWWTSLEAQEGFVFKRKRKAASTGMSVENDTTRSALEVMVERNKKMHSSKSVETGRNFKTRPSDVFIVTYPKCGTTWVTQICHQLRTGGDDAFEEISVVVPWDIMAHDCGQDLEAEQMSNPRLFKSHERRDDVAKGAKYIHVSRRPEDAFMSFYKFLPAFDAIPPGEISVEEFATAIFAGASHSGGIWDFFAEWWERRQDPDVLWVCFEDLKSDLRGQLRRIGAFMLDAEPSEELLDIVEAKSRFEYMEARTGQFDEHWVFDKVRDQMGIPKEYVFGEIDVSKVRAGGGKMGEGKALPESVTKMLEQRWQGTMAAKTGLKSYDELRKAAAELQ